MPIVAMPDGSRVQFPDTMPPDQIKGFIQQKFPDAVPKQNPMEGQGTALDTAINGLTMGFGDEAAGAIGGALDWAGFGPEGSKGTFSGGYDRVTGNIRNSVQDYRTRHPIAAAVSEVAGSIPTMAIMPGGSFAEGASLGQKVLQGAAMGAGMGGVQGFGNGEGGVGNRLLGAAEGAGIGGAIGGAVPLVGRAVSKIVGSRGSAVVPTIDDLESASNALRDQAKQIGMVIKPETYDNIASDLASVAQQAGVDEGVTPTAYKALQRVLNDRPAVQGIDSAPMTLDKLDTIRKVLGNASREVGNDFKPTPSAAVASKMLQRFDQRMSLLGSSDVAAKSGDPQIATGLIKQSRKLWARKIKADVIQNAMEYGSEAASGAENGIRNEFRKLLKPGKYNWTPAEKKAIQDVVRGGFSGNMLRFLGTFGIPIDQGRSWLGAMGGLASGAGGGFAMGGPVGAGIGAMLPAVGTAAKYAGRALTNKKAELVDAIVRNGGVMPVNPMASAIESGVDKIMTPVARGTVPLLLPSREKDPLKVYIGAPSPGYR